ncbi:MAG: hypothetical protein PHC62_11505 [Candidatus Izemoplasmatales bacterium]|nr:hypothetical protein [Candidatus Izemoplasmatales bacterium]
MKTLDVINVYKVLNEAKLSKMDDSDKFKVIKAVRALRAIANDFEELVKDVQEKLKDESFAEMQAKAQKWQDEGEKTSLSIDERKSINQYFSDYSNKVDKCLKEEGEKDNELTFEKLTDEALDKLSSSNDWNVKTIIQVQDALCL